MTDDAQARVDALMKQFNNDDGFPTLSYEQEQGVRFMVANFLERIVGLERQLQEAQQLAYLGDHHFPDLTYKARLEELSILYNAQERQLQEAQQALQAKHEEYQYRWDKGQEMIDAAVKYAETAEARCATLQKELQEAQQARDSLQKQLHIVQLSIPLEEELDVRISEMLKYLAMQDGFTLNGIARLLIETQRRMATDWVEIGNVRRSLKAAEAQCATQVAQLKAVEGIVNDMCNEYGRVRWKGGLIYRDQLRAALSAPPKAPTGD